jgi:hypothetical protein
MKTIPAVICVFGLLVSGGCCRTPDQEDLRREILDLHQSLIQAHLDKDAAFLARPTAEDYLSVARGELRSMTAADVEAMLAPYLAQTEFSHYEDVADPVIGVSDDGSLAWSIVQVRVAGTRTRENGEAQNFDTLWAWLTLYRRDGDGWQRIADVSTNRPFEQES